MPDFWLIAAYVELNMKANMFAGRRLLLQSLRNNDNSQLLHIEYFKYELAVLEKLKQRKLVLEGAADKDQLEFVDEQVGEKDAEAQEDGVFDASENLLVICFETIQKRFP